MDYSKISNATARNAIDAWQQGNKDEFLTYFISNPELTDDDAPRDFKKFVEEACGKEKFLEIDSIEDEGKSIYGKFDAGPWGIFRVYFRFHFNEEGKIHRLDIGQAK